MKYSIFLLLTVLAPWVYQPLSAQSPHQVYDLRPGVERLFDNCLNFPPYSECRLGDAQLWLERVLGDVAMSGKTYASVQYNKILEGSRPFYIPYDTLFYRVDGQKLFRWVDGVDRLLYDFSITKGGSIDDIQHESPGYYAPHMSDITLKADYRVLFPEGEAYRMLFGDDSATTEIDSITFVNDYLSSQAAFLDLDHWSLPFKNMPDEGPPSTFLYIERFGLVLTPFAETNALMLAFKSHDGVSFGARVEYLTPTNLETSVTDVAKSIELFPAYPNPFNPTTQIRFTIPESGWVQLTVHDILGREVAILVNGILPAGEHQSSFDASNLSSGVFLYSLRAGNTVLTGKLLLVR